MNGNRTNIKDRLAAFCRNNNGLADGIKFFDFVNSKNYAELIKNTWSTKKIILEQHQKFKVFKNCLNNLHEFEKNFNYSYESQRLHFPHQLNVYLIGLFLYSNFTDVKRAIDTEMEETTEEVEVEVDGHSEKYRFSGENPRGEFLFRWRMAALAHDLGYVISLLKKDDAQISENLKNMGTVDGCHYTRIKDVNSYGGNDLLNNLSAFVEKRTGINIKSIGDWLAENPAFNETCYYDHGIISAIMFLNLINREYSKQIQGYKMSFVGRDKVVWHKKFLDGCFMHVAMAVALHNLDVYRCIPEYEVLFNIERYKKLGGSAFSWLLKTADMLQDWDKPKVKDYRHFDLGEALERTNIDFEVRDTDGKLIVHGFEKELDKVFIPSFPGPVEIAFT